MSNEMTLDRFLWNGKFLDSRKWMEKYYLYHDLNPKTECKYERYYDNNYIANVVLPFERSFFSG